MYALNKWTDESMRRAIADFRQAIERDPDFAPAYVALAEGNIWLYPAWASSQPTMRCLRPVGC